MGSEISTAGVPMVEERRRVLRGIGVVETSDPRNCGREPEIALDMVLSVEKKNRFRNHTVLERDKTVIKKREDFWAT